MSFAFARIALQGSCVRAARKKVSMLHALTRIIGACPLQCCVFALLILKYLFSVDFWKVHVTLCIGLPRCVFLVRSGLSVFFVRCFAPDLHFVAMAVSSNIFAGMCFKRFPVAPKHLDVISSSCIFKKATASAPRCFFRPCLTGGGDVCFCFFC